MTVLVTGASGFAGSHLMKQLQTTTREQLVGTTGSQLDLTDYEAVKGLLAEVRPTMIYHLAAFSSPALSFGRPAEAINSTLLMQINLFEACLELGLAPRILLVSSGQIYGSAGTRNLPLTEEAPLDFVSPYAVAKAGQEHLASYYGRRGFDIIIARPFNHVGPGQQPGFLVADLAQQVAELEQRPGTSLKVGNLSSKRDYTDVRDIVRAYVLLAAQGRPGQIYNVCTGKPTSGQQILDLLLSSSHQTITTEPDPSRMRPADIPELYGDPSKLQTDTDWHPVFSLDQTLRDTLEYWRGRV
jgi:GDP-4-dehydro-6-deoxy-D-mannose reductase